MVENFRQARDQDSEIKFNLNASPFIYESLEKNSSVLVAVSKLGQVALLYKDILKLRSMAIGDKSGHFDLAAKDVLPLNANSLTQGRPLTEVESQYQKDRLDNFLEQSPSNNQLKKLIVIKTIIPTMFNTPGSEVILNYLNNEVVSNPSSSVQLLAISSQANNMQRVLSRNVSSDILSSDWQDEVCQNFLSNFASHMRVDDFNNIAKFQTEYFQSMNDLPINYPFDEIEVPKGYTRLGI